MIVAFMKPLVGAKKNGRTIADDDQDAGDRHAASTDGQPLARRRRATRAAARELAHPASLVSSPSSPRGRRTMIRIR